MWWAWNDVLPALGNINATVWQTTVSVIEEQPLPDGKKQVRNIDVLREITLADLGLAAIILATTMIAAKNIPGLLEMAVLQHLPFDAGTRYAVATVSRYAIFLLGLLLGCSTLGVSWSKVQWFVAAMSLGLGFGLQEIFANFVSGLIILLERPIRVRDVVTIDNITGVVSRIRMRATTITDPDRKELIIPNKEFITGRVLNWTLTDPVNRVVINVGLAYGSDTQRAAEILLKVAQEHPNVLDDPPPRVTLDSFGDSALNFVLRCFLPNLESRATVIHELNIAIDRALRAAGIEMPFPQQDIHVRSIDLPASMLPPAVAGNTVSWPAAAKSAAVERAA
jgi:potassium efflux system protein